jgi:signal transduction histidine kinase
VAGVINVANPVGRRVFRQRDVDLIEAAAGLIGGALAGADQDHEIRTIHKNLEEIFNSLHVGILSVGAGERLTHGNQRARALLGLTQNGSAQNGSHLTLAEALPGTVYNVCQRLIRQALQDSEPAQDRVQAEINHRHVMLEITASRLSGLGQAPGDCLIMFEDAGQDEEVRRLRESECLKRNFLTTISHELRTPLTVIRGALPLIDPAPGRPIESTVLGQVHQVLLKNCRRLNDVVNSILDVTEIESGTLALVRRSMNLHELLDEVAGLHAEAAAARPVAWICHFGLEQPEICADHRRLLQVFSELAANAIKFSNPGGRVSIQTRASTSWVEIEIANTGARIDDAQRKIIFEKFHQCDQSMTRSVGGLGLGLFLVQNLLRLHGGGIELVDGGSDEETKFLIRLPRGGDETSLSK